MKIGELALAAQTQVVLEGAEYRNGRLEQRLVKINELVKV